MTLPKAFVGLGANLGDPVQTLRKAKEKISALPGVYQLEVSKLYLAEPVTTLPQPFYLNAVCAFQTTYTPEELMVKLEDIERDLGKKPKPKEAPRLIDLDLLFFGQEVRDTLQLQIPHPQWRSRLFVLVPLKDLIKEVHLANETVDIVQEIKGKRQIVIEIEEVL